MTCPKCGEECYREEVDVEIGVIYGPWHCPNGCLDDKDFLTMLGLTPAPEIDDRSDW